MVDVEDCHGLRFVIKFVHDPVLAAPSRIRPRKFLTQRFTHASRLVEQVPGDEVHDRSGNAFGEPISDLTCG